MQLPAPIITIILVAVSASAKPVKPETYRPNVRSSCARRLSLPDDMVAESVTRCQRANTSQLHYPKCADAGCSFNAGNIPMPPKEEYYCPDDGGGPCKCNASEDDVYTACVE